MSDYLTIVFDRSDRHPDVHEYGPAIDSNIEQMIGGRGSLDSTGYHPRARLIRLRAEVELHETGPVFVIEAEALTRAETILANIKQIATDWAVRDGGGQDTNPSVSVRFGPSPLQPGQSHYEWDRITVTTHPATIANRLDDVIGFVTSMK